SSTALSRGVSLFLPRLTPTGTGQRGRAAARRWARAWAPWLLKPMRLMMASSAGSRNSRGRGLPGWGRGVTVPVSTKPKPRAARAGTARPSLSKPAARPMGLSKFRPQISCFKTAGASGRRIKTGSNDDEERRARRPNTHSWASSAARRTSQGRSKPYISHPVVGTGHPVPGCRHPTTKGRGGPTSRGKEKGAAGGPPLLLLSCCRPSAEGIGLGAPPRILLLLLEGLLLAGDGRMLHILLGARQHRGADGLLLERLLLLE